MARKSGKTIYDFCDQVLLRVARPVPGPSPLNDLEVSKLFSHGVELWKSEKMTMESKNAEGLQLAVFREYSQEARAEYFSLAWVESMELLPPHIDAFGVISGGKCYGLGHFRGVVQTDGTIKRG